MAVANVDSVQINTTRVVGRPGAWLARDVQVLSLFEEKFCGEFNVALPLSHGEHYPRSLIAPSFPFGTIRIDQFLHTVVYRVAPVSAPPSSVDNTKSLGFTRLVDGTKSRRPMPNGPYTMKE